MLMVMAGARFYYAISFSSHDLRLRHFGPKNQQYCMMSVTKSLLSFSGTAKQQLATEKCTVSGNSFNNYNYMHTYGG